MQDTSTTKRGWDQDGHPQDGFDGAALSALRFPSRAEAGKTRRYNTFAIDGCRSTAPIFALLDLGELRRCVELRHLAAEWVKADGSFRAVRPIQGRCGACSVLARLSSESYNTP